MSISTGKGDGGESGLIGGSRAPKDDLRFETYGTVDELNSVVALARTLDPPVAIDAELERVSRWLFSLGSDLATPGAGLNDETPLNLPASATTDLDSWIHREEGTLPALRRFILPGGTPCAAALHLARTVCRRAERRVVALGRDTGECQAAVVFLNRLSDLLFLYARRANAEAGVADVEWSQD